MFKFLAPYLRPHKKEIVLGFILNASSGVAMSVQTLMPKYLVDDVLMPTGLTTHERLNRLALFSLGYLLITIVLRMILWHASYRYFTHTRESVLFQLRSHFFRQINSLCLRFHLKHNSGELYNYLFGSPLVQVQQFLHLLSMGGPVCFVILITTLFWVCFWDWTLAATVFFSLMINVWLMYQNRIKMQNLQTEYQKVEGDVSGYVADLIRGNKDIKLHAVEERMIKTFDDQVELIRDKSYSRDIEAHMHWMKQETMGYVFYALVGVIGAWRYFGGHITSGELVASLAALSSLQGPVIQLFTISTQQGSAAASLIRLKSVLDEQSSTPDPVSPTVTPTPGPLEFHQVKFHYDRCEVFTNLNLKIPVGTRLALVGPSGSGKSTLVQLLLRLYDPHSGAVTLNGVNLREFNSRDLRKLFGVVPQDPYLFRTTLKENLLLLKPDATEAEIQMACEQANAWEFIQELPQKLETQVGENGATFSGGQRQRLAIARALLANPPFLIFDEATSALDPISEKLIQQALGEILKNRTSIFIAHRLSTVTQCDQIAVLDKGVVVQLGTFQELANTPGVFKQMLHAPEQKNSSAFAS